MKEGQDKIYLRHRQETFNAAKNSPTSRSSARRASKCCCSPIASTRWVIGNLTEFDGKQLQSVAKGGLTWARWKTREAGSGKKKAADEFKDLLEKMKASPANGSRKRVTHRLTDSPACLVADEHTTSA